jgi:sugar phosphate isomerase/epimerase
VGGVMTAWGIVSNCFRKQLAAGALLTDLIGEAVARGYRVIELRQTCLGEFETGDEPLPLPESMTVLSESFPGIRFDVAIAVPFLQVGFLADDEVFTAGKWAAHAVAGEYAPHLRLVDLSTKLIADSPQTVGNQIARLTRAMIELDGILSVEHSLQPWSEFRAAFDAARSELGPDGDRLRLCYDPCNLLFPGDGVDPAVITASLKPAELSMVHAKQRSGGPLTTVANGDIDWKAQAAALKQMGYGGPILFEIDSHAAIWSNLESSRRYLQEQGFDAAPAT